MTTRILIFSCREETRKLYSYFLRAKGYEVLQFSTPATCALLAAGENSCFRDRNCADVLLVDMEMQGMTGLEFLRHQQERGCRILPQNKLLISTGLTTEQDQEVGSLGCAFLIKPFRLSLLLDWLQACERNIPQGRQLAPCAALLATDGSAPSSPSPHFPAASPSSGSPP